MDYLSTVSLHLNRFRTLDSNLGRWLSPDPLARDVANPQSLNRYAYAMNNPTSFADPLGLECVNMGGGVWGDDEQGNGCDKITAGGAYIAFDVCGL